MARIGTSALLAAVLALIPALGQETRKNPSVVLDTSLGKIKVELFADKAPITVKNFLQYVDDKFYDGTIFHRVLPDYIIQGGGHERDLKEKTTRGPIKNEASNGLSNKRGTIAMARDKDADSATAQFYINVKDNLKLDRDPTKNQPGYAVFGQVIDGIDVVDKIRRVETGKRGEHKDVPLEPILVRSIRRAVK
jgi:cyclophilin family peptidyl-prolyl cis-trans isomerase